MIHQRPGVRRPARVLEDRPVVVVVEAVLLDVLGEEPEGRGDGREGEVEFWDLVEREEGDVCRLGARGEGRGGGFAAAAAAAAHELASEQEVGLADRGDVLLMGKGTERERRRERRWN